MSNIIEDSVKIEAINKVTECIHEARKIAVNFDIDFACIVLLDEKRVLNTTNGDSLKILGLIDILKDRIINETLTK